MKPSITISDELAARLQVDGPSIKAAAQKRIDALLAGQYTKHSTFDERREAVEAMLRFADEYGFTLGTGDLKSTLHEGHKY